MSEDTTLSEAPMPDQRTIGAPSAQTPVPAVLEHKKVEIFDLTDLDLPPIRRTEANFWRARYFEAMVELAKLNKGIRRLKAKVKRLKSVL